MRAGGAWVGMRFRACVQVAAGFPQVAFDEVHERVQDREFHLQLD